MHEIRIKVPSVLRSHTTGQAQVKAVGATVGDALQSLQPHYAGLVGRLLTDEGQVRSFVNIYLGTRNISTLSGLRTPLNDGAVLTLVHASVGG